MTAVSVNVTRQARREGRHGAGETRQACRCDGFASFLSHFVQIGARTFAKDATLLYFRIKAAS
jgi:hypothetical protein